MDLLQFYMILGFMVAALATIGNDALQTLGTFLTSNAKRPWWVLWAYVSSILAIVLLIGYFRYGGDLAFGRLDRIPFREDLSWYHVAPVFVLLLLTRFGIPVSTTVLVLSVFSTSSVLGGILMKSVMGYMGAFVVALFMWWAMAGFLEKRFKDKPTSRKRWVVFQWLATGLLWSQWLMQDMANVFVFLPRQLDLTQTLLSILVLVTVMAFIVRNRAGKILRVVETKFNTQDIRSASLIDVTYAALLYYFKQVNNLPMSTTWVFLGLLAGREFALSHPHKMTSFRSTTFLAAKDLGRATLGLVISVVIVLGVASYETSRDAAAELKKESEEQSQTVPLKVIEPSEDFSNLWPRYGSGPTLHSEGLFKGL